MKRFMMIAVVLGGLIVTTASDAKADHRYRGGRSGFGISINYGNGFSNFGSSYGRGYGRQFGGYGGGYGGGYYGGGYGYGNPYPTYSVPIYRGGFSGYNHGFGGHRHCR